MRAQLTTPNRHPSVRQLYKAHIAFMLGRTNSINGQQYASDPTIYGVDAINEPRWVRVLHHLFGLNRSA